MMDVGKIEQLREAEAFAEDLRSTRERPAIDPRK